MRVSGIFIAALAGILLSPGAVAQDLQRGEELFALCAACHGAEGAGNAQLRTPRIGGLESAYLVEQLESFRAGTRGHPESSFANQMRVIAQTLADEQAVADVAAYAASLQPQPGLEPVAGDLERGELEYRLCSACHGPNGEGNPMLDSPRLAGLSDRYLLEQVRAFRQGTRGYSPEDVHGVQMRTMALALRDEQAVKDVVAYTATLEAPPAMNTTVAGDPEAGADIYTMCSACHGSTGEGNGELGAPRLAGQHDWYLLRQLEAFRSDVRGAHAEDIYGQQMRQIALTLQDRQTMEDVVRYIANGMLNSSSTAVE